MSLVVAHVAPVSFVSTSPRLLIQLFRSSRAISTEVDSLVLAMFATFSKAAVTLWILITAA